MPIQRIFRSAFAAMIVLFSVGVQAAHADSGIVVLTIFKGGWIIGGSAGHGTLKFGGKTYPLSVGGIDYGLVFGGSKTVLRGSVKNIKRASDVAGVYAAAGAGLAVGVLSGNSTLDDLGPLSDAILGSIAELPQYLAHRESSAPA